MIFTKIKSGVYVILLSFCVIVNIESAYALPEPPFDVNKYWDNIPDNIDPNDTSDHMMCWAAAASNVLSSVGWGLDVWSPYDREYDVYHEFLGHFPDQGGHGYVAYEYYFNQHYPSKDYTDYYVQINHDYNHSDYIINQMKKLLYTYDDTYPGTYGIYLSIANLWDDGTVGGAHAITVWDVSDIQLQLIGGITVNGYHLTITDSDDNYTGYKGYDVFEDEDDGRLFMEDYYGSDSWFLRRIDALAPPILPIGAHYPSISDKPPIISDLTPYYASIGEPPDGPGSPGNPVPEPSTLLLVGIGLLPFLRRRR